MLQRSRCDDTYQFSRVDGYDRIRDWRGEDALAFEEGITADQLWFSHDGKDLNINLLDTNDQVSIARWYKGSRHRIERIELNDGSYLLESQVQQLVSAMAGFSPVSGTDTVNLVEARESLQPVLAAAWQAAS